MEKNSENIHTKPGAILTLPGAILTMPGKNCGLKMMIWWNFGKPFPVWQHADHASQPSVQHHVNLTQPKPSSFSLLWYHIGCVNNCKTEYRDTVFCLGCRDLSTWRIWLGGGVQGCVFEDIGSVFFANIHICDLFYYSDLILFIWPP